VSSVQVSVAGDDEPEGVVAVRITGDARAEHPAGIGVLDVDVHAGGAVAVEQQADHLAQLGSPAQSELREREGSHTRTA